MRGTRIIFAVFLMSGFVSGAAYGKEPLDAAWKTGLRFTSSDKAYQIKVGGRLMNDWAWLSADDELKSGETAWESGTEFRRARLYVGGHIHENVKFKVQYDFAGGDADFKDAYIALTKIPGIGQIKVGRFKQPFGLEELMSSKYITFMERAMAMEAFAPSRQSGILIGSSAWDKRLTWALSTYRATDGYGEDYGDNDMNYAARITLLPWETGDNLLHLGAAYAAIKPNGDSARFRARPEMHLAPMRLADTRGISSDNVRLLGVEAAAVFGPASVQGEFISASVSNLAGDDANLSGYYVFGSFFLTGESRPYKKGVFKRVKPNNNFGAGAGALEAAVRLSSVDLEDGGAEGREVTSITAGLNWYLNPNTRVMLNYVSADQKDVGKASGFMTRFQVDF